jgi:regulatory protein
VRRRQPSSEAPPAGGDAKAVELTAVRLLSRREHTCEELRRKLLDKGYAPEFVEPVVEKLAGKRLVSDDRYVASFVHAHTRRGQGPARIRAELRQRGIDATRVEEEFARAGVDWVALAAQVRRRKFGAAAPKSLTERAKQSRFLQYRGFEADQIRAALSVATGSELSSDSGPELLVDEGLDPD